LGRRSGNSVWTQSRGRHGGFEPVVQALELRRRSRVAERPEILKKFDIDQMHEKTNRDCAHLCIQLFGIFEMVKHDFNLPTNVASRLTFSLPRSDEIHAVKHAPPWPVEDHAPFIKACREYRVRGGAGKGTRPDTSLFTECLFLTCVRTVEIREATWAEIDWHHLTWNIPYNHRKTGGVVPSGKIRPIPITSSVETILREMERRYLNAKKTDPIFPVSRERKHGELIYADDTIRKHIQDSMRWHKPLNPHSARNGLNSWAGVGYDVRLTEYQLDHALSDETRKNTKQHRAYHPDTLLEERRKMMKAFDAHCSSPKPLPASVTNIAQHRRSA
jgi:integrase